jgi:NitT/TauT family transport system permease protein
VDGVQQAAASREVALARRFDYFIYPIIVMFQAMPKVALAPLIIVWFGLGITSKVVNAALVCVSSR